jgi:hypothetical protein
MPKPPLPGHKGRPPGRRRAKLLLAGTLVLLLLGILLVGTYKRKGSPKGSAEITLVPGGPPAVVQVRAAAPPRSENVPYVLSPGQEIYVDVRAAGIWLLHRMGELGKQDLDPRAKVTLDTVVYDPETEKEEYERHKALWQEQEALSAERESIKAVPDGPEKKARSGELDARQSALDKDVDQLLLTRRSAAWDQFLKDRLERSCLVVNGRVFRDLNAQFAYDWHEYSQLRLAEFERRAAYYKAGWVCRLWRSLNDLISESNDGRLSFDRFQMIAWNLVFGVIFVRAVYYKLAMPELSNGQLLLMGISNGTYLGFKWSMSRSDNNGEHKKVGA